MPTSSFCTSGYYDFPFSPNILFLLTLVCLIPQVPCYQMSMWFHMNVYIVSHQEWSPLILCGFQFEFESNRVIKKFEI